MRHWNEGTHAWGGNVCIDCTTRRKLVGDGFAVYLVRGRWTSQRPDCRVIAADLMRTDSGDEEPEAVSPPL